MAKLDEERKKAHQADKKVKQGFIPCLYLPYLGGSSKLLIYFHGNAEDIGLAMELLAFIKDMLKVSSNPKNILKLFDVGACPRDGVSRLWSLRRRSRCRLDCARRSKYL